MLKVSIFVALMMPLARISQKTVTDMLGPNPVETLTHFTGDWALYCLLLTLSITPLRKFTRWNPLARFRRMLGLFAFFYACLHFLTFLVFDHFFDWQGIYKDILKRPYITVGFLAFILLVPLAVTSTDRMMLRLGGKLWKNLHKLIYVIAVLGIIHFTWLVKADLREPLIFAALLSVLMIARWGHLLVRPFITLLKE